jgi:hypothetical protein
VCDFGAAADRGARAALVHAIMKIQKEISGINV